MKIAGLLKGDCADGFKLAGITVVCPKDFSKDSLENELYKICGDIDICALFISSGIAEIIKDAIENQRKISIFPLILITQENFNEPFNKNFLIDYIFNSTGMKV